MRHLLAFADQGIADRKDPLGQKFGDVGLRKRIIETSGSPRGLKTTPAFAAELAPRRVYFSATWTGEFQTTAAFIAEFGAPRVVGSTLGALHIANSGKGLVNSNKFF